jgi:hypothetical protein
MAKKKKKSRLKKFLKGAALAGAAALGAKALMGNKGTGLTTGKFLFSPAAGGARYKNPMARARKAMTSNAAYSDDTMPGNLSKNMGMYGRDSIMASPEINRIGDYYKKGGRVGCGIAKKGFGKALKKGGKK